MLLSDEARKAKEDEIMEMEKKVREMQKERFGPNGLLFEKRKELVQPIQDRVYSAIQDYANDRGYDFIFDNSGSAGIIFANPEYDKTNDVVDKIRRKWSLMGGCWFITASIKCQWLNTTNHFLTFALFFDEALPDKSWAKQLTNKN